MIKTIHEDKCTGCGICANVCPLDTIRIDPFQEEIPPCQNACPANVDMRAYIQYLKLGMQAEALRTISMDLPFPAITGRLCHHPCTSKCARKNVDETVKINDLERYLGDALLQEKNNMEQPVTHAAKVAVIGSGPMGLSAAYFIRKMGYKVEVFESETNIGGLLREEVNKSRLPGEILEKQINYMKDLGIEFRTNFTFSYDDSLTELMEQGFRAVLLSTGFRTIQELGLPKNMLLTKGGVKADPLTLETEIRGLFAGGGITLERVPIAEIVGNAKRAAVSISRYLRKEDIRKDLTSKRKLSEQIPKDGISIQKSQITSDSFNEEAFLEEAQRCMTCGAKAQISHLDDCMTCYSCELNCPYDAIYVHPFKEELPASFNY